MAAAARLALVDGAGAAALSPLRPLAELDDAMLARVNGLLCDIDDTLTTRGILEPETRSALARLRAAGLIVAAVTGRSAGFAAEVARDWPVDGAVAENGGTWVRVGPDGRSTAAFAAGAVATEADRAALIEAGRRAMAAVPGAAFATDQRLRLTDIAIDHAEHVAPLGPDGVARLMQALRDQGLSTTASSIHVHGHRGTYDKRTGVRDLFAGAFGRDLDACRDRLVFVGDSGNDAAMFAWFPLSVGVANVARFLDRLPTPPAYVTRGESGAGVVELAERLLAARRRRDAP